MRFPHVSTQFCKKNDSKDLVYAGKVVIVFYVLKISQEIRWSLRYGGTNPKIVLWKMSFLVHLQSANGFNPSSWYILLQVVIRAVIRAPVVIKVALYFVILIFILKDPVNSLF